MRIGELATQAGVSVRALRYYEEQGLLSSTRNSGGQRVYVESDVDRVRLFQTFYSAGMPSRAIADVLTCVDHPTVDHNDRAWTHMLEVRDRLSRDIDELVKTREALDVLLAPVYRSRDTARVAP